MGWLKGDQRTTGIVIISVVLLLALLIAVIALVVGGHQTALPGQATGTEAVQATPTVDATAVVQDQLKQQDEKLQRDNSFPWTILNTSSVGSLFLAVAAILGAWIGFTQWRGSRKEERRKRDEERFQKVVEGLGSEREEAKVGAAIMLRTFLQKGYEQFHSQTLDLAVGNLQLQHHADQSTSQPPNSLGQVLTAIFTTAQPQSQQQASQNTLQPPDPLSQALITVFKESFPLVREQLRERLKKQGSWFSPQLLDATAIQLDKAYLCGCDLKEAWMPNASLREADLKSTGLAEANLEGANLTRASLNQAILTKANLINVTFTGAVLEWAELDKTILDGANLTGANLTGANLTKASLTDANLTDANLTDANLTDADLSGANPEAAKSLLRTKMQGVNGLTNDQRKCCVAKRAFVEDVAGDQDQLSIPNTS